MRTKTNTQETCSEVADVLICGSRSIDDKRIIRTAIETSPWQPDTLIHGGATGVDAIADRYARIRGVDRDVHAIPDWVWEKIGSKAGPIRNGYMVEQADAMIAVWNGDSPGTSDAVKQAESNGLPIYKIICDEEDGQWVISDTTLIEGDQKCLGDFE